MKCGEKGKESEKEIDGRKDRRKENEFGEK
jgi:hypothetical protein